MTPTQLADTLLNGAPESRTAAAQALASMGESAAPAAVALAGLSGDPVAGEWCVAALEELGPPPASAVESLVALLSSDNQSAAYWAATLLGRLEAKAAPAVAPLANTAAQHPEMAVRERAVWALGKIGPAASDAKPLLETLSNCEHARLARLATQTLQAIG